MACPLLASITVSSPNDTRRIGDILKFRVITNGGGLKGGGLPRPCRDKLTTSWVVTLDGSPTPFEVHPDMWIWISNIQRGTYKAVATATQPGPVVCTARRSLVVPHP